MTRFYKYSVLLLTVLAFRANAGDKLLIAGSGWNKVAILDKDTKQIEWSYEVEGECNNMIYTKKGDIAVAYKSGASLINKAGDVLWDFKAEKGEELFSVAQLKKGGYMLAMCGNPARIIELSEDGKVVHELKYDTGIEHPHSQFRQVKPTDRGTYIVPLLTGDVREIDRDGNLVRSVKIKGNVFSVVELPNGNWLLPCGDAGFYAEVNPETSEIVERVDREDIEGVKFAFVAELVRYKNGNTLISNWLGHSRDKTQPLLIEVDAEGKEVWRLNNGTEGVGAISAVMPLQGKFYR